MEHRWILKTENPHPYWEERKCTVCGLEDQRVRDQTPGPRQNWGVTTPCIEPVPAEVDKEAFERELEAHQVKERVLFIGTPGKWMIGFSVGSEGYHLYPILQADTPEHAYAALLTWIRARQYNVRLYSQYEYLDGLYRPQSFGEDD